MNATAEKDVHVAAFERLERELARSGPAWLEPIRKSGMARFAALGFPTTRDEDWRFTNVEPIARTPFGPSRAPAGGLHPAAIERLIPAVPGAFRIVFVNGAFSRDLSSPGSLPRGARAASLAAVLAEEPESVRGVLASRARYEDRAFTALNTAFIRDGAYVHIPEGAILAQPVHIVFISAAGEEPEASHPRTLIIAGRSSQGSVVESYVSAGRGTCFTNAVTEVHLGENAVLEHVKVERESPDAFHVATIAALIERSGNYASRSFSLGGAIVRNDIDLVLDGEGIECHLDGLYLGTGSKLVDNHTRIEHAKPHCDSREVYKGILAGSARAVFNGKIHVRQDAQKTDAKQQNKNLLLSGDAVVDTKPELEIFADDVKCTHGATVGQLDDLAMFYLRSRGLDAASARNLLIHAFASDVIARVKSEPLRGWLDAALVEVLSGLGRDGGA
jgi:Fe-S cluster assembly protein SufD